MIDKNALHAMFKQLRQGDGLTESAVARHPYLYEAFGLQDAESFIAFVQSVFPEDLEVDYKIKAAFSALAFRVPPGRNLRARRLKFLNLDQSTTQDFEKNLRRKEDEGILFIVDRLVSKMRPEAAEDKSKLDRLERQVKELESLTMFLARENYLVRKKLDSFYEENSRVVEQLERLSNSTLDLIEKHVLTAKDRKRLINVLRDEHDKHAILFGRTSDLYRIDSDT